MRFGPDRPNESRRTVAKKNGGIRPGLSEGGEKNSSHIIKVWRGGAGKRTREEKGIGGQRWLQNDEVRRKRLLTRDGFD